MQELLLIGNPARRRKTKRKTTGAKRRPSAAQLRARAKFAAMSRSRAKARRASTSTTRSNPIVKRRRHVAKRAAPARVHHKRRTRRNPARRSVGGVSSASIMSALKSAGLGAGGAIAVDALFGFAQSYLPASLATDKDASGATQYGYYVAKGALAFGAGMLAKKAIGAAKAAHMVQGSLTVTLHDLAKNFLTTNVPSVTLGKYPGVPVPMPQGLRGMPGGRVLPPLPASQSLRAYTSGATREAMLR